MKKLIVCLALLALCVGALIGCFAEAGKIGILTPSGVSEDELNENLQDTFFNAMPFSGFKFFDTFNSLVLALGNGTIEAIEIEMDEYVSGFLFSRIENLARYKPADLPEFQVGYCMLLREGDAELRDEISACIAAMNEDGTIETLKQTYIEDVIAGEEPDAIESQAFPGAKTIKVAVTGDRPPMDYVSPDGAYAGFNTAVLSEVGKRIEKNIELVQTDSMARAAALASCTADAVFWTRVSTDRDTPLPGESPEHHAQHLKEGRNRRKGNTGEEERPLEGGPRPGGPGRNARIDMPVGTVVTDRITSITSSLSP